MMALAAGAAMAIESANVVGYQNLDINGIDDGGFSYLVSTLPSVGKSFEELTLNDFSVVSPEGGLTAEASVYVTTFTSDGQMDGEFLYIDEALVDQGVGGVSEIGWYTKESIDNWEPVLVGDTIIPFGTGVIVQSDCGAKLTCAGTVLKEGVTFNINSSSDGGFTYTGNTSPVACTLKDFAITSPEGGLTAEASVYVTTFSNDGQMSGEFLYIDEALLDQGVGGVYEIGWHTKDSIDNWEPVSAGDEIISAGQMFIIQSDCGAFITIPSAIGTAE